MDDLGTGHPDPEHTPISFKAAKLTKGIMDRTWRIGDVNDKFMAAAACISSVGDPFERLRNTIQSLDRKMDLIALPLPEEGASLTKIIQDLSRTVSNATGERELERRVQSLEAAVAPVQKSGQISPLGQTIRTAIRELIAEGEPYPGSYERLKLRLNISTKKYFTEIKRMDPTVAAWFDEKSVIGRTYDGYQNMVDNYRNPTGDYMTDDDVEKTFAAEVNKLPATVRQLALEQFNKMSPEVKRRYLAGKATI